MNGDKGIKYQLFSGDNINTAYHISNKTHQKIDSGTKYFCNSIYTPNYFTIKTDPEKCHGLKIFIKASYMIYCIMFKGWEL